MARPRTIGELINALDGAAAGETAGASRALERLSSELVRLSNGTTVRVIGQHSFEGSGRTELEMALFATAVNSTEVEILDGQHAGATGWGPSHQIKTRRVPE